MSRDYFMWREKEIADLTKQVIEQAQRIAELEKEVEAAEKRGFEAAIKQVGDWALLGSTRDTLIRSGDILLKLDRMAQDYEKSLKG